MIVSVKRDLNEGAENEEAFIVEFFCNVTFDVRGLDEFDMESEIAYGPIAVNYALYTREDLTTINEYISINHDDLESAFYNEYLKLV
jgi:hypothetical protein